jgi:CRISPR system Cascade subunit CasB
MNDTMDPSTQDRSVGARALAIARALSSASTKDRAETRRMDDTGSPFFWRMAARLDLASHEEKPWLVFTRMAAMLTSSSTKEWFHDETRPLGAVLADGGDRTRRLEAPVVSEARLARLLAARGGSRLSALERSVRGIARETRHLDAVSLAWAVLNPDGQNIAKQYYRRLDHGASVTKD